LGLATLQEFIIRENKSQNLFPWEDIEYLSKILLSCGQVYQGCHLAFLILFARNKIVWPFGHFFGLFECRRK